jgi:transposase
MTNKQISLELLLTIRQITEIKRKYRQKGDTVFIHGNIGRIPVNKTPELIVANVIDLRETVAEGEKIFDKVNFSHFRDILEEEKGIKLSKSTVRKVLKDHGYSSPKKHRSKKQKKMHPMRPRKQHAGELVQADGSPYDWLGDGKLYCIQGFIDDATGIPLGLYMTRHECLLGYLEATRQMLTNYGIPEQLYPDRASVFFINNCKNKEAQNLTQFGRIMEEYGVDMFPAYSPQAKGRIERFWETIQSRLFIEFKMRGIKTIEAANAFLPQFMKIFSRRFGVKPISEESRFVPLTFDDLQKMNKLLVAKEERVTDGAGAFSLQGYKFAVKGCCRERIAVIMSIQDGIYAVDKHGKRRELDLLEDDYENPHMPEVLKELIAEYFMKDTKAKYRGAYQKAG